jgi:hypothetical protein
MSNVRHLKNMGTHLHKQDPRAYALALKYWRLGIQYLHLAQQASDEIAKQGNAWVVVGDGPEPIDYAERTKWSDHMVATPVLFNFFHGIELMLKGFSALNGPRTKPPNHSLSSLATAFNDEQSDVAISQFLAKYLNAKTVPSPLKEFLASSHTDIDKYYQALKYPESVAGQEYMHNELYYKGEWGLPFYCQLRDDIAAVRPAIVSLGRSLAPHAH